MKEATEAIQDFVWPQIRLKIMAISSRESSPQVWDTVDQATWLTQISWSCRMITDSTHNDLQSSK